MLRTLPLPTWSFHNQCGAVISPLYRAGQRGGSGSGGPAARTHPFCLTPETTLDSTASCLLSPALSMSRFLATRRARNKGGRPQVTVGTVTWRTGTGSPPGSPESSRRAVEEERAILRFSLLQQTGSFPPLQLPLWSPESSPCCSCRRLQPAAGEGGRGKSIAGFVCFFFSLECEGKGGKKRKGIPKGEENLQ